MFLIFNLAFTVQKFTKCSLFSLYFIERGPAKFILVNAEQNWSEAQTTVKNRLENNEITKLLSTESWIGLFNFLWSLWSDQTQVTFKNWHEIQRFNSPESWLSLCLSTNTFREYHFIKILKNWAEAQRYCRENFHDLAAVEDQNENQKLLRTLTEQGLYVWIGLQEETSKWKWSKDNEHYYDKQNWSEAQSFCRSMYTDLATVQSRSENDEITKLLSTESWIGLFKLPWSLWSDQTQVTFKNWHKIQRFNSSESCGVVNTTTGMWWNIGCEEQHYFICQSFSYPKNTARFRLKFQSEADVHDPITQQQILKQVHHI
uniref:C-type lectin domain-containing protein n=1 Tax=Gouania willdenowi TaxID=441366 RepID=A0A8C5ESP9_GOUWI